MKEATKMKATISLLFILLVPAFASAQVVVNGNHVQLTAPDATPASVKLVSPNAGGTVEIWSGGSKRESWSGAGVKTVENSAVVAMAPYVPTPVATPVAATNQGLWTVNAIPTAAANTAFIIATPAAAGQKATFINTGPNAVRAKAGGSNTINGSAAGAYIPLAALSITDCESTSAGTSAAIFCGTRGVPTPAGP
jgi:hypothetical protein